MEVPKFLLRRKYRLECVFFVALFSILFMAIYQPFSATAWFGFGSLQQGALTALFYLVAILMMISGKQLFALYHRSRPLKMRTYLSWIGGEFLLIALLYILFTSVLAGATEIMTLGWIVRVVLCVSFILAIPYALITLYMSYREKNEELNLMRLNRTTENEEENPRLLHLNDNNGTLKMSIDIESLYYVESQDNYVRIYYELEGKLVSYMLRCKTQTIEEMLAGTSLIRCHRSHIVNTNKVKLYKKEHDRAKILLTHPSAKPIPVSKSYFRTVTELIEQLRPAEEA